MFTDAELEPDAPFEADRCGSCTRCLDACPTRAFTAPRKLDATRCISYLTIELKGEIPAALRPAIGELLYGCDICQDVCPWNHKFAKEASEPAFAPRAGRGSPDARTLARSFLAMSRAEFSSGFRDSAVRRAKLTGLKRNGCVVRGNVGPKDDVPPLAAALSDPEPLVREHAAWALGRFAIRGVADGRSDL